MIRITRLFAAIAALTFTSLSYGQAYPSQALKIIVPYSPGGITDIVGRNIADKLSTHLGQSVIVENRVGASGTIGATAAARTKPDGYTLFVGTSTTHGTNPSTQANLKYDPEKDFVPVAMLAAAPFMMIVNNDVPANTIQEFISYLKSHPSIINYATPGAGGSIHLSTELFAQKVGAKMNHIPYKGSAPALVDLMGGQVQVMLDNMPSAVSAVRTGKVHALAITGSQRSALAPEVPTLQETALPGFNSESWIALYAPAGTPSDVIDVLNKAVNKSLKDPGLLETFKNVGLDARGGTPDQLATYQAKEIQQWSDLVTEIGYEAK